MFETLFAQQSQIYQYVLEDVSNANNRIALFGNSGCGKTTLTEHIIYSIISLPSEWMVFDFVGDEYCIEKDYFPLISGLNNYCQKYKSLFPNYWMTAVKEEVFYHMYWILF